LPRTTPELSPRCTRAKSALSLFSLPGRPLRHLQRNGRHPPRLSVYAISPHLGRVEGQRHDDVHQLRVIRQVHVDTARHRRRARMRVENRHRLLALGSHGRQRRPLLARIDEVPADRVRRNVGQRIHLLCPPVPAGDNAARLAGIFPAAMVNNRLQHPGCNSQRFHPGHPAVRRTVRRVVRCSAPRVVRRSVPRVVRGPVRDTSSAVWHYPTILVGIVNIKSATWLCPAPPPAGLRVCTLVSRFSTFFVTSVRLRRSRCHWCTKSRCGPAPGPEATCSKIWTGAQGPLESGFARRPEAAAPWPHQPAAARRPTLYSGDDISCQSCHWCHSRANRLSPEYKVPLTTRVIRRAASCHILGHGAKALCTAFSRLDRDVRRSIAPSLSEVGVNFGLW